MKRVHIVVHKFGQDQVYEDIEGFKNTVYEFVKYFDVNRIGSFEVALAETIVPEANVEDEDAESMSTPRPHIDPSHVRWSETNSWLRSLEYLWSLFYTIHYVTRTCFYALDQLLPHLPNVHVQKLQIYNTDKSVIWPSVGEMPFYTALITSKLTNNPSDQPFV